MSKSFSARVRNKLFPMRVKIKNARMPKSLFDRIVGRRTGFHPGSSPGQAFA
jgi:hypothetical protein